MIPLARLRRDEESLGIVPTASAPEARRVTDAADAAAAAPIRDAASRPWTPVPLARGTHGAVVAPHHLATPPGSAILRAGGSAVDAAIATNAVLAVVMPGSCGLGGDAFWLIWDEATGTQTALNGSGRAPAAADAAALRARGLTALPRRGPLTDHGPRRRPLLGRRPRPTSGACHATRSWPRPSSSPARASRLGRLRGQGRGAAPPWSRRPWAPTSGGLLRRLPSARPAVAARRAGPPAGARRDAGDPRPRRVRRVLRRRPRRAAGRRPRRRGLADHGRRPRRARLHLGDPDRARLPRRPGHDPSAQQLGGRGAGAAGDPRAVRNRPDGPPSGRMGSPTRPGSTLGLEAAKLAMADRDRIPHRPDLPRRAGPRAA